MKTTIETTMDAAGRLVIPKAVRDAAGLTPGVVLRIQCRDGRVELTPAPRKVEVVQHDRVTVLIPSEESETLTGDVVRAVQRSLRDRHSES